jgi:hypothetical protein
MFNLLLLGELATRKKLVKFSVGLYTHHYYYFAWVLRVVDIQDHFGAIESYLHPQGVHAHRLPKNVKLQAETWSAMVLEVGLLYNKILESRARLCYDNS